LKCINLIWSIYSGVTELTIKAATCKPVFDHKLKEDVPQHLSKKSYAYGSLEGGISGNYTISISDVLNEAWELTQGINF